MRVVRTVRGDVPVEDVGFCSAHDHVLIRDGIGTLRNPDLLIDDVDRAVEEVLGFLRSGGHTLVDAMPLDCGRDPSGLVAVSERTDAHIVATTGFHTSSYYEADHWSTSTGVDVIADLLVAEVLEGMDSGSYSGPIVRRLTARAGLVKCASGHSGLDATTVKLFEAAAICHLRSGAPILTHTEHGALALEHIELLTSFGVPADAILVSHVDRAHDHALHRELAGTGAYLVYDGPSRSKYHPPEQVGELMRTAVDAGAGNRVLVGLDLALRSYRTSYGGVPGLCYLLDSFWPVLRQLGFADDELHRVGWENPAAALSLRMVSA